MRIFTTFSKRVKTGYNKAKNGRWGDRPTFRSLQTDTLTILENTNRFVGGFSVGFETRIKSWFFLELDIKTYFDVGDKTRFGGFGTTGSLFLGVNYYINQGRKKGVVIGDWPV
ncbi:MAG: hypothetical protein IPN29_17550 [Saprospiraceae bacterium]|nr:hypothetical protein [Saprospiraceae bacterium]